MAAPRTIEVLHGDALVVRVVVEGPRVAVMWAGSEHEPRLRLALRGAGRREPDDARRWLATLRTVVEGSEAWRLVERAA